VRFVADKVSLGHVLSPSPSVPPVSIIPPLLHIHSCIIWGIDFGPIPQRPQFDRDTVSPNRNNNMRNCLSTPLMRFSGMAVGNTHFFLNYRVVVVYYVQNNIVTNNVQIALSLRHYTSTLATRSTHYLLHSYR
jgi:hypothetical protein